MKRSIVMIPVGNGVGNLTKAMAAKIDSERGWRIYHHRMAIAEEDPSTHSLKRGARGK